MFRCKLASGRRKTGGPLQESSSLYNGKTCLYTTCLVSSFVVPYSFAWFRVFHEPLRCWFDSVVTVAIDRSHEPSVMSWELSTAGSSEWLPIPTIQSSIHTFPRFIILIYKSTSRVSSRFPICCFTHHPLLFSHPVSLSDFTASIEHISKPRLQDLIRHGLACYPKLCVPRGAPEYAPGAARLHLLW